MIVDELKDEGMKDVVEGIVLLEPKIRLYTLQGGRVTSSSDDPHIGVNAQEHSHAE